MANTWCLTPVATRPVSDTDVLTICSEPRDSNPATRKVGAVTACHRLTIRSIDPDPRSAAIRSAAEQLGTPLDAASDVAVADLIFVEGDLDDRRPGVAARFLVDPLLQHGTWSLPAQPGVEVAFLPGVTDGAATTLMHAARPARACRSPAPRPVAGSSSAPASTSEHADAIVRRVVANPVIERWSFEPIEPVFHAGGEPAPASPSVVQSAGSTLDALVDIGVDRALALDPDELRAIHAHFDALGPRPDRRRARDARPDVERALRAQDVPGAAITDRRRHEPIAPLLRRSCATHRRRSTRRSCVSAFVGNAGIVSFTAGHDASRSRPRRTTTRRRSSRSAAPTPASAA